jgi:hypothetical protein
MAIFQIFTLIVATVGQAGSERCRSVDQNLLTEPRLTFTQTYSNETWGFSLAIPANMTAYSQTSPPYHGVWFVLGQPPHGSIIVSGEANSLEFKTPRDAARDHIRLLRNEGKKINSTAVTTVNLAGLRAARMETHYSCGGDPVTYAEVYVAAFSPKRDPLYEIVLLTTLERLRDDRPVFERVLRSWKFIGP